MSADLLTAARPLLWQVLPRALGRSPTCGLSPALCLGRRLSSSGHLILKRKLAHRWDAAAGLLLVFGLLLSAGCQSALRRSPNPLDLVPSRAVAVLFTDWRGIQGDPGLRQLASADAIEENLRQLGIEADDIGSVVTFSDARDPRQGAGALIVSGPNARVVMKHLASIGWKREGVAGGAIFVSSRDESCAAAVGRRVIVLGTRAGVEAVRRSRSAPSERLWSNSVAARLRTASDGERHPLRAFVVFPQGLQDAGAVGVEIFSTVLDVSGLGAVGELLGKIGVARGFAMTCSSAGNSYPTRLFAVMSGETAAKLISGGLNLIKGLSGLVPEQTSDPEGRRTREFLGDLTVTRDGDLVRVDFVMPEMEMRARPGEGARGNWRPGR